ncbi:amidohydrolase family protein [Cytobacillus sp. S13-E01]|uniref:metal-dependent hydrolase family protein n=1 Tax=Cytobacillus sp. S13-E01 TaxID=3031326 RepID=UPI0023D80585|nr:amidohydrolase family protein [Cytobacillus sp. S13-E01]MDF0725972.1 amidohydrolase family protein [Cytobacillus sp. S13-E01]
MKTLIKNTTIITCEGEQIIQGDILFDESGILEVATKIEPPLDNATYVIDGTGKTVLPGLIDCHVHLGMDCSPDPFKQIAQDDESKTAFLAHQQGQEFLKAGITTIRNLGTRYNVDIKYRNAIKQGYVTGPRIYAAGRPVVMTGGHGHVMAIEADGEIEIRKAVRSQLKAGADVIKLMATGGVLTEGNEPGSTQLSEHELRCACQEATNANKTTAAHTIGTDGIKNAIRAGVTTIEHAYLLDDEAVELMKVYGTYVVPTLVAPTLILDNTEGIPVSMLEQVKALIEEHRVSFKMAHSAGIPIAAGTDAGTPYNFPGLMADELALYVKEGMTPLEAIKAATITAAKVVKADHLIGSLEAGKLADVIIVAGNPLEDLSVLKNVEYVFSNGNLAFSQTITRMEIEQKC